jgi:hypothetical protein
MVEFATYLTGCLYGWCGAGGAHDAARDEALRRTCGIYAYYSHYWDCSAEYGIPNTRKRADITAQGELYFNVWEVKPNKPGEISKGRRQVRDYVNLLNASGELETRAARGGKPFEPFVMKYHGWQIQVQWVEKGLIVYSPTCHPKCEDVRLSKYSSWYSHLMDVVSDFIPIFVPAPVPAPVPVP